MAFFSRSQPNNDVPEEFLDATSGQVKTEALLAAYHDLKRRNQEFRVPTSDSSPEDWTRFRQVMGIPETPDGYQIVERHPDFYPSPDINARLHQAGFTPAQVQLVYDLAVEIIQPLLERNRESDLNSLCEHFGGSERWTETARQIMAWGQANLEPRVYDALNQSADGIKAMRAMMENREPGLGRVPSASNAAPSEADLKKMIQDPRYWKQRDPQWIDQVSDGFRRLSGA